MLAVAFMDSRMVSVWCATSYSNYKCKATIQIIITYSYLNSERLITGIISHPTVSYLLKSCLTDTVINNVQSPLVVLKLPKHSGPSGVSTR